MKRINIVFDQENAETGLMVSGLLDYLNESSEAAIFGTWNMLADLIEGRNKDNSRNEAQITRILEIIQGIVATKLPLMNQEEGDADD